MEISLPLNDFFLNLFHSYGLLSWGLIMNSIVRFEVGFDLKNSHQAHFLWCDLQDWIWDDPMKRKFER